jgi:hypothetical protein
VVVGSLALVIAIGYAVPIRVGVIDTATAYSSFRLAAVERACIQAVWNRIVVAVGIRYRASAKSRGSLVGVVRALVVAVINSVSIAIKPIGGRVQALQLAPIGGANLQELPSCWNAGHYWWGAASLKKYDAVD